MNDSRYRGPSRPGPKASFRNYGRDQTEREPEFEEEYQYRASRGPRDASGERRPSRGPRPSATNPAGPPTRSGRDGEPGRSSRPMRQGEGRDQQSAQRSDPTWEAAPRPDRELRPRPRSRSAPDWEREPSPRSGDAWESERPPRGSGRRQEPRQRSRAPLDPVAKKRKRLRYLALVGLMVSAGLAGVCINFGVFLLAIPLMLLSLASAGAFVYF